MLQKQAQHVGRPEIVFVSENCGLGATGSHRFSISSAISSRTLQQYLRFEFQAAHKLTLIEGESSDSFQYVWW